MNDASSSDGGDIPTPTSHDQKGGDSNEMTFPVSKRTNGHDEDSQSVDKLWK